MWVTRNGATRTRTVRADTFGNNTTVAIADGDNVVVTMQLDSMGNRAPFGMLPELNDFITSTRTAGVGYTQEALRYVFSNAPTAFKFGIKTDGWLEGAWRVPDGTCTSGTDPITLYVPVDLAALWDPLNVPIGATYGGSFRLACDVAVGRVTYCEDVPAPDTDVEVVGDCGKRVPAR